MKVVGLDLGPGVEHRQLNVSHWGFHRGRVETNTVKDLSYSWFIWSHFQNKIQFWTTPWRATDWRPDGLAVGAATAPLGCLTGVLGFQLIWQLSISLVSSHHLLSIQQSVSSCSSSPFYSFWPQEVVVDPWVLATPQPPWWPLVLGLAFPPVTADFS